jgi:hypothetical protein
MTVVNATTIRAVTAARAAGTVDVVVTNPDGDAARLPGGFGYTRAFVDTLVPRGTPIRREHILELRRRIAAARQNVGLVGFPWTDTVLDRVPVRAIHFSEMRAAIAAVYVAKRMIPPGFTDPVLTAAVTVSAAHINELRAAVAAIE